MSPGDSPAQESGSSAMRVLSFTALFPNEARPYHGLFVRARLEAIARRAEVRVIAPVFGPGWLHNGRIVKHVPYEERQGDLRVAHPRNFNFPKILKGLDAWLLTRAVRSCFRDTVAAFHPDVVDAHFAYPDGTAACRLAKECGLPYFLTVRGGDIHEFLPTRSRREHILEALHGAERVIGVCQDLVDSVVAAGVPRERCVTIPNGVDLQRFFPEERSSARRRLGLEPDRPMLLYVGRISPEKGLHLLVEALSRVRSDTARRALLVLLGPAERPRYAAELEAQAARCGLGEHLRFVGAHPADELRWWYSAADVLGLASHREGWPNVVLEAMACACPVVAVDVGGVAEAVPHELGGLVVPREADALASALDEGFTRTWDRESMLEYARARSWDRTADACLETFRQALENRAPPPA